MTNYLPVADRMNVRHDAVIRVTFTERGSGQVLDVTDVPADSLGGHLTVASITYNRLSVSGGVSWWDPRTGRPLRGIQYALDVDEQFVLAPGQLCTCTQKCCPVNA